MTTTDPNMNVGYGKWRLQASGQTVIMLLLLLALGLFIYELSSRNHVAIEKGHVDIVEELAVQTYLLSLPAEQRPRLIIPKTLKDRIQ